MRSWAMIGWIGLASLGLTGCTGKDSAEEESEVTSTIQFLDPIDGDTVTAGDVTISLLVDGFTLTSSPAMHGEEEGVPTGFIQLRVDGADTQQTVATTTSLSLAAGAHTLEAELMFEDGDALEPAVKASVQVTAE